MTDLPNDPRRDRLLYLLQRAFVAAEARKAQALSQVDLLPAHYALLMNLRAHPSTTAAELARLLGVTPQNVASLVARLIDRDLIRRSPHAVHRRILELRLTPAGERRLARADRLVDQLETQVIAELGLKRSGQLKTLLSQVRATMGRTDRCRSVRTRHD